MNRKKPYDREEALNAALSLFWSKGYHATSLKDLEAALEMKPGSIYAAFSSKQNLFELALGQYYRQRQQEFIDVVSAQPSPLQGLRHYLESVVLKNGSPGTQSICMLVKTVVNATTDDQASIAAARTYLKNMEQTIKSMFDKAKELGEIASDADTLLLAQQYQSDMTALRFEAHLTDEADRLEASLDRTAAKYTAMNTS